MRTIHDRLCVVIGAGLLSAALLSGNGWSYLEAAAPHPTTSPRACGAPETAGWQCRATEAHRQVPSRWTEVGSRDLQAVLRLEVSIAGTITE
jgi:hypothetical protein